jgi:ribokinase
MKHYTSGTVDVLVIGSLNMDLVAFVPRLPLPGETLVGFRWTTAHGGKGGNQAVAAARLGARVAMVGRVGQDEYGPVLRNALMAEGIDCEAVGLDPVQPTGIALITVESGGQNSIVVISGSNGQLSPDHIDAQQELFASAKIVVCQMESPLAATARAIELGNQFGKFVILNPAPVPRAPHSCLDILSKVNLLIPNDTEASQLTGLPVTSPEQAIIAAERLRTHGCGAVIVTLGASGVVHSGAHYPSRKANAVDTTAAGDTFIGSVAASLARDPNLVNAIALGQSAAAIAVSRPGAQSSIPTLAEVLYDKPLFLSD